MKKPQNNPIIVYVDRNRLSFYAQGLPQVVNVEFAEGVEKDLEILRPDEVANQAKSVLDQLKIASGQAYVPAGRSVAVYKDGSQVFAVSTVCTHLGCLVKATESGFDCPCHGSKFAKDGAVLKGPAPKGLPWLEVKHLGGDNFLVDEGKRVAAGTTVAV